MASFADLVAILLVLAALVATINHRFIGLPTAIALLLGSLGSNCHTWMKVCIHVMARRPGATVMGTAVGAPSC
jgi:hypothetical protein